MATATRNGTRQREIRGTVGDGKPASLYLSSELEALDDTFMHWCAEANVGSFRMTGRLFGDRVFLEVDERESGSTHQVTSMDLSRQELRDFLEALRRVVSWVESGEGTSQSLARG